jgi:membrane fusion protein, multidrug efflux system
MKKKIRMKFIYLTVGILVFSCGNEETKLDKLIAQKNKLKTELSQVQDQIALLSDNNELIIPLVSLGQVENKLFLHKIRVQGNVETDEDILLNAEMGGLITSVLVKEGQFVQSGQVLITLDAEMISSSMQELQTQLDYAKYMLEKQEELRKRGVGTEFDYKAAKKSGRVIKIQNEFTRSSTW